MAKEATTSEEVQYLIDSSSNEEFEILATDLEISLHYATHPPLENALRSTRSLKTLDIFFESMPPCYGIIDALLNNGSVHTFSATFDEESFDGHLTKSGTIFGALVLNTKTITSLKIRRTFQMQKSYEEFCKGLEMNQSLTSLSLSDCFVTDAALKAISGALKRNTILKSLDLSINSFEIEGCRYLGELLKYNATLDYLTLSNCVVPSEGWKEFFCGLKMNSSLTELNLAQNKISDNEVCHYMNDMLKSNKTLMHIDLSGNGIGSDGLNNLFRDIDFRGSCGLLTSINLRNTKLDSKCCETLAKYVSVNDKMTELDLSFNNISAEGCKWLGTMLKHNKALTTLNMTHNKIGSEGAQWLADGLRVNTRLCYVVLQDCAIKSEGCTHLAAALAVNPCLMHVNLNGNDIGAQGCAALVAAMQTNQSVTELSITKDKKISAVSLEQLIDAQNRNKRHQRALISNVMTTLVNMARRAEDLVSLLPLEIWLHVFKHVVCGGVPGFDQIALALFTNQIGCRDITSLVKMKIVRKRGKSVLAKPSNDD